MHLPWGQHVGQMHVDFGIRQTCYFWTWSPQAAYFTALSLSFFIWVTGL